MAEENLESKLLTEEDKKNAHRDCIKGTGFSLGALFNGVFGLVTASLQEPSLGGYVLAGCILISTLGLAGLSYSRACYYFTPRSERENYAKAQV
jgi:hypothetical protein